MSMTYASLIAPKGTVGSIANWVSYSLIETNMPTILDEAQALIYQILRVHEMRTTLHFKASVGMASLDLPSRFLDPIGHIKSVSQNFIFEHHPDEMVKARRPWSSATGTLGTNPLTTTNGSSLVSVHKTGHALTQDSLFDMTGATAVGGITPNGTFEIDSITGSDDFVVETNLVATSGAVGGGSSIAFQSSRLEQGQPSAWSIWDEKVKFDQAFNEIHLCQLQYYQSLPLLSSTNTNNFLTNRHPQMLRRACMASAAEFMEETETFNRSFQLLQSIVTRAQEEDDLRHRSEVIETANWGAYGR